MPVTKELYRAGFMQQNMQPSPAWQDKGMAVTSMYNKIKKKKIFLAILHSMRDWVPQSGMEPARVAVEALNLNHWTTSGPTKLQMVQ